MRRGLGWDSEVRLGQFASVRLAAWRRVRWRIGQRTAGGFVTFARSGLDAAVGGARALFVASRFVSSRLVWFGYVWWLGAACVRRRLSARGSLLLLASAELWLVSSESQAERRGKKKEIRSSRSPHGLSVRARLSVRASVRVSVRACVSCSSGPVLLLLCFVPFVQRQHTQRSFFVSLA